MVKAADVDLSPQFFPAVVRDQYIQHHFQGDTMAWIVFLRVVHCFLLRSDVLTDLPMMTATTVNEKPTGILKGLIKRIFTSIEISTITSSFNFHVRVNLYC